MGLAPQATSIEPPRNLSSTSPPPSLDKTYGALFIGMCFGLMLYGLTVHQCYRYARMYRKDALWVKCLVSGILALDTLHTLSCVAAVYYHLVSNFSNPASLVARNWVRHSSPPFLVPITNHGISFYAFRLYRLGSHYVYLVLVAVAVRSSSCMHQLLRTNVTRFRISLRDFQHYSVRSFSPSVVNVDLLTTTTGQWLICGLSGSSVFVDTCLMGTLITALLKSKTGLKRSDSLIEILVLYSINAGLLTSIFALLTFIFALALPGNLIYIAFSIIGVKLYANSVLAVLNSRQSLSNRMLQGFELSTIETNQFPPALDIEAGPLGTWKVHEVRSLFPALPSGGT
ncbi:hypothetical protein FKP32DRAFT_1577394 [Trametes sanguinea]|nr:hypothetical protein FKP32DRAFT_1577394 [Trametes sanguinea]